MHADAANTATDAKPSSKNKKKHKSARTGADDRAKGKTKAKSKTKVKDSAKGSPKGKADKKDKADKKAGKPPKDGKLSRATKAERIAQAVQDLLAVHAAEAQAQAAAAEAAPTPATAPIAVDNAAGADAPSEREIPLAQAVRQPGRHRGRRIQVRRSGVHGKGVFALQPIEQGEVVIEYVGDVIGWPEALRRHPHDPTQPDHTFYFHIDEERVIDGNVGGNASRWINHACDPNLEAEDEDGRIFLVALRDIMPGEELSFDYGLVIEERYTKALKQRFACHCGLPGCRGTMLAPKDEQPPAEGKAVKAGKGDKRRGKAGRKG